MSRALPLVCALACCVAACRRQPEPRAPTATTPAPTDQTLRGAWYELHVPLGWIPQPMRDEAEHQVADVAYRSPQLPRRNVILMRPAPMSGDLEAWVDSQRPGLAMLGSRVINEDEATLDGVAVRRIEALVESQRAAFFYWLFVRDGMASGIQCAGDDDAAIRDECRRIAESFRFRGRLERGLGAASSSAAVEATREVALAGFAFNAPADWLPFPTPTIPSAVWTVRSQRMVGRMFPNAMLTVEPFAGDLATYDRVGDQQTASQGVRPISKRPSTLLELPAIEVLSDYPPALGGHRALQFEAVGGGRAYVLTCSGDPALFDSIAPTCATIARSLRRAPP